MKIFKISNYLLINFVLSAPCYAANHYIRSGATGANNGSDWTNARTDLPATFVRGDTYYVADATYGEHLFDTALSGTTYVYIKKATTTYYVRCQDLADPPNANPDDDVISFSVQNPSQTGGAFTFVGTIQ